MNRLSKPGAASEAPLYLPSVATIVAKSIGTLSALALTLPLAGCNLGALLSGGPSAEDVAAAVRAPKSQIHDVSCASAQTEPGYNCTFSWTTPQTGQGIFERGRTDTFTKRFVKTGAGVWRLVM